jgi:hypothetical protein
MKEQTMIHPVTAIRAARRSRLFSKISMALAAGFLVWSGTAMIAMNMAMPGIVSCVIAAFIVLGASEPD